MNRIFQVARREFVSTVMTKGFLIGVAIIPLMMMASMFLIPMLVTEKPPKVSGTVAIIDRTGVVAEGFSRRLSSEALMRQYGEEQKAQAEAIKGVAGAAGAPPGVAAAAADAMAGALPDLKVEILPAATDVEQAKEPLRTGTAIDGGRIALVVIDADAVKGAGDGTTFGAYQIYVKPKLDQRIDRDVIRSGLMTEISDQRMAAAGEDPKRVRALLGVPALPSQTVLAQGTRKTVGGAQFLLPFGFIMLLWVATMTGGQYLLTTTVEEKSNRIMEVLLSAVSPMQLMIGKILGQMSVALLVLLVYTALGTGALVSFKLLDLLEWQNVGLLIVYFLIAFFLIASLMAAVGSAVSEVHEAQSLIGPIMMVLVLPMVFSPAIINNPNGGLATALSFIPPVSPFVMVLRIPAAETIPAWQIAASIAIGLASVMVAAWAAAKIFRIGVLMYGKPPNLGTLLKWVRMA